MTDVKLLTETEVADLLRVCTRTVRRFRQEGELPYYSLGRKVLYSEADIADFIERHRVQERPLQPTFNVGGPRKRASEEPTGFMALRRARQARKER